MSTRKSRPGLSEYVITTPRTPYPRINYRGTPGDSCLAPNCEVAATSIETRVHDERIRRWIVFALGAAAVAMLLAWLGRELFRGDDAVSKLALSFLSGFLGFALRRRVEVH